MTVEEKFKELVEQKRFLEIEDFLECSNFDSNLEKVDFWFYYIQILENQNLVPVDTYQKVLKILFEMLPETNSLFIEFCKKVKKYCSLSVKEEIQNLKLLWDHGELETYYENANELLIKYLNSKSLAALSTLIIYLNEKNSLWPRLKYFQLMIYAIQNDISNTIKESDKILSMLQNDWKRLKFKKGSIEYYYLKLVQILESIEFKDAQLELYIMYLKGLCYANLNLKDLRLSKREIIKLIIAYPQEIDALVVALVNCENHLENILLNYLKSHEDFSLVQIKNKFRFVHKYFSPKTKITFNKKDENTRFLRNEKRKVNKLKNYISSDKEYKISKEDLVCQKDLINQIKSGKFSNSNRVSDLVVIFYNLNLIDVAVEIILREPKSTENIYLLCELYFKQQKYIEVISEIGLYKIENKDLEIPIELMYLEAESYLHLNKRLSAKKVYQKILLKDPGFRQTKERLNNA